MDQQFFDDFARAEALHAENRLEDSLALYQALLRRQPGQVAVLNNTGLLHEKMGDYESAVHCYQRCHDQQPNQIIFVNNLANALCRLGRWQDARPLLETAVEQGFDPERNTERYALCLVNTGARSEACAFVTSVIDNYPDNALLHRVLGKALLHENQHAAGLGHLRKGSGFIAFSDRGVNYIN